MRERRIKYFFIKNKEQICCIAPSYFVLIVCFSFFGQINSIAQYTRKLSSFLSIHNPVLDRDFPDPTVIRSGNKFYAYATQAKVKGKTWNIQIASSTDLQHWKMEGDALPQKPTWANTTHDFWAPHVLYDSGLKKYVLFYSAKSDDTTTDKCIGVAFAINPLGPFIDKGSPLICGQGFVNIDPMALIDTKTGKKILYWGSGFQPIKVQEMNSDWTDFKPASEPKPVVWPGKDSGYSILIEGAWLDYNAGNYYLYYSGDNCCGSKANYAVMVAKADNSFGRFTRLGEEAKTGSSVILARYDEWIAPGHNSIFRDENDKVWIAYHAIHKNELTANKTKRVMCISPVVYKEGWPQVTAQE